MSVWDDLVGQQNVVDTLRRAISDPAAMTHAWLLTGPPGSGRSNAARAFAAALQCPQDGCGVCAQCLGVLRGTHPDVSIVATEKVTIAIDEVRDLIGKATRTPSQGRWRVIIIEDADRMMERTTNVLLKAIEEPPARTIWLLCAPSPQDVMVTIRSRCRSVTLRVPPLEDVAQLLMAKDGVDEGTARICAAAAQAHIGLAHRYARDPQALERRNSIIRLGARVTSVPDAVYAAAQLLEIAQHEAQEATAERDAAEKEELLRTLGAQDAKTLPPALRSQIKALEDDQKRRATRHQRDVIDRSISDLMSLHRDILLLQTGTQADFVNTELSDIVHDLAGRCTPEHTLHRIDAMRQARTRLAGNVAPLLALEAMLIQLR
ncbi:DNA polymerase III subunit delta' [Jonesia quinghaiensis]|uniref:DNA polymerase III subunit delta' n=1 Tax=Jonesia quinghaiensis TaxID=262806 RepID=UPI00041E2354|nr:DNA polymerase III subunit delta' [Jonesia quinghaiensis]